LGLLCSAVAYVLFFRILAAAGPTNLALVTLLVPVGALLLGSTLLAERLEPRQLAGMAVIFLGLATVDGRFPAALFRRATRRVAAPGALA
jgi:drug/metabolite transporter (DMT)-like permease